VASYVSIAFFPMASGGLSPEYSIVVPPNAKANLLGESEKSELFQNRFRRGHHADEIEFDID
jgi:hypothetical protein